MRNNSQPIRNPRPIHLLHIRHHDRATNPRPLKLRQHRKGMHTNSPPILMMPLLPLIPLDALPVPWVIHSDVRREAVARLGRDDVGEEHADGAVGARGLDGLAGLEGCGGDVGVGGGGAEEAEAEFAAFAEAVFELFGLVRGWYWWLCLFAGGNWILR